MSNRTRQKWMNRMRRVRHGQGYVMQEVSLADGEGEFKRVNVKRYILKDDGRRVVVVKGPNGADRAMIVKGIC